MHATPLRSHSTRCFPAVALALVACAPPVAEQTRLPLLAPAAIDRSLALPAVDLDLRIPAALAGLEPSELRLLPGADGLSLFARGTTPALTLLDPAVGVRAVVVELRSENGGALALAWAKRGEPFGRPGPPVTVAPGVEIVGYRLELPAAATAAPRGVLLRLDFVGFGVSRRRPNGELDSPELSLRALRFETADGTVAPGTAPVVGKFRVGIELRLAAAVPSGSQLALSIPSQARQLTFGVARRLDGPERCALEVTLDGGGAEPRTLLATELARDAAAWSDYSVHLRRAATARELRFAPRCPAGTGHGWAGAVYVATPELLLEQRAGRPDILLVSLDTVSAEAFEAVLGSGDAPHFARLARRGVRFTGARTNSSVTSTAHASLLSGRLPGRCGVLRVEHGLTVGPTLAELLRSVGYSTAATTGGVLVHERFGHDRGFDRFAREDALVRTGVANQSDVDAVADHAKNFLDNVAGGPRFLFLHSYEAHAPYLREPPLDARPEWRALRAAHVAGRLPFPRSELARHLYVLGEDHLWRAPGDLPAAEEALALARETYRSEIARLDRRLGPLLERFVDEAPGRGAILAVTADHGESFFEHGLLEHGLLEESNLHIPLLVVAPGLPAGVERAGAAYTVDVMPTLLELAGIESPKGLDGRSLVALARGASEPRRMSYAFTSSNGFAFEGDDKKWVVPTRFENENLGHEALYDRAADPGERANLLASGALPDARLVAFARATWAALPGLHLDLSPLAGRELDIDATAEARAGGVLHAWGLGPAAPGTHHVVRRRLKVGADARLWWLAADVAAGAAVELVDSANGARCRIERAPGAGTGAPFALEACRRAFGVALESWRVAAPSGSSAADAPSAAELEQLRALGYVR